MLVLVIAAGGLIADGGFIMGSTAGADPVPDGWVDADMKRIVEGRIGEASTEAPCDSGQVLPFFNFFFNSNLTSICNPLGYDRPLVSFIPKI